MNKAIIDALKMPESIRLFWLHEYHAGAFLIAASSSVAFTLVEATVYPGRTIETKRELIRA